MEVWMWVLHQIYAREIVIKVAFVLVPLISTFYSSMWRIIAKQRNSHFHIKIRIRAAGRSGITVQCSITLKCSHLRFEYLAIVSNFDNFSVDTFVDFKFMVNNRDFTRA